MSVIKSERSKCTSKKTKRRTKIIIIFLEICQRDETDQMKINGSGFWRESSKVSTIDQRSEPDGEGEQDLQLLGRDK